MKQVNHNKKDLRNFLILIVVGTISYCGWTGFLYTKANAETVKIPQSKEEIVVKIPFGQASDPTIVFSTGFNIIVNKTEIPVFGFEECPKRGAGTIKIFGTRYNDGDHNCIVLSRDKNSITANLLLTTSSIQNQWTVERQYGEISGQKFLRVTLHNSDGSIISPAQDSEFDKLKLPPSSSFGRETLVAVEIFRLIRDMVPSQVL